MPLYEGGAVTGKVGVPIYGPGTDGDGEIPLGTHTIGRSYYFEDLHVYGALVCAFPIWVNGTLYVHDGGSIHQDGGAASGSTGGTALASKIFGGGIDGAAGGTAAGSNAFTRSAAQGGAGGAGGAGSGGAGGTAAVARPGVTLGDPRHMLGVSGYGFGSGAAGTLLYAGTGGGGGGGSGAAAGGGGGASGARVWIAARHIVVEGTGRISANGGAGAAGPGADRGGGGGGGGGVVEIMCETYTGTRPTANGGAGGAASTGASVAGADGLPGDINLIIGGEPASRLNLALNAALPYAVTAADARRIMEGGDLKIEATLVLSANLDGGGSETGYLMAGNTADGEASVGWDGATESVVARLRGSSVIGTTDAMTQAIAGPPCRQARASDYLDVGFAFKPGMPGTRSGVLRLGINGCHGYDTVVTASGNALNRPSNWYIGGHPTLTTYDDLAGTVRMVRAKTGSDYARHPVCEGFIIGDSIVAARGVQAPIGADLFTAAQHRAGRKCFSLAMPAATVADQQTALNASAYVSDAVLAAAVRWVVIQCGVNSVLTDVSAATTIAALQTMVTGLATQFPNASIVISEMTPCASYTDMTSPRETVFAAVNAAIRGEGGSPITGVAARVSSHVALLADGVNLAAAYDSGDGLHPNDAGRLINADAIKATLQGLGRL